MKKSLLLTAVLTMGLSVSAAAANPFSDVPAGHWAYGSIAKLAAAGVVDGYPDGSFQGDKLMTRYEMAQIVARAMAKGANVDRLASEFADELDALGVRVTRLEKKSDNVRITGQARYEYFNVEYTDDKTGNKTKYHNQRMRNRFYFTGDINDNWQYNAMLQNYHSFNNEVSSGIPTSIATEAGEGTAFQRGYLTGRLGGVNVTAGRFDCLKADGNVWDTRMDAVMLDYGKKVHFNAYYGRPTDIATGYGANVYDYDKVWGAAVSGDVGKLNLAVAYDKFTNSVSGNWSDDAIWSIGAKYDFGKFGLNAMYLKSNLDNTLNDTSTGGVVLGATFLGANPGKAGSWGLFGKYYNQGAGTFLAHTMCSDPTGFASDREGFKGYMIGGNVALAKNTIADLEYYDLKGRETDNKVTTLWSHVLFLF